MTVKYVVVHEIIFNLLSHSLLGAEDYSSGGAVDFSSRGAVDFSYGGS
jgi:hypothetical protein